MGPTVPSWIGSWKDGRRRGSRPPPYRSRLRRVHRHADEEELLPLAHRAVRAYLRVSSGSYLQAVACCACPGKPVPAHMRILVTNDDGIESQGIREQPRGPGVMRRGRCPGVGRRAASPTPCPQGLHPHPPLGSAVMRARGPPRTASSSPCSGSYPQGGHGHLRDQPRAQPRHGRPFSSMRRKRRQGALMGVPSVAVSLGAYALPSISPAPLILWRATFVTCGRHPSPTSISLR